MAECGGGNAVRVSSFFLSGWRVLVVPLTRLPTLFEFQTIIFLCTSTGYFFVFNSEGVPSRPILLALDTPVWSQPIQEFVLSFRPYSAHFPVHTVTSRNCLKDKSIQLNMKLSSKIIQTQKCAFHSCIRLQTTLTTSSYIPQRVRTHKFPVKSSERC